MDSQLSQKRVQARKDASDSDSATDFGSSSTNSDNASQGSQGEEAADNSDDESVKSGEVH